MFTLPRKTLAGTLAVVLGLSLIPAVNGQIVEPNATTKAKAKARAKSAVVAPKTPLDLNKATAEEMTEILPGVGEVTARKIVAGRPYATVDELAKAGVPARTIAAIRPLVTIAPAVAKRKAEPKATVTNEPFTKKAMIRPAPAPASPATKPVAKAAIRPTVGKLVNINTASREALDVLPGIGPVKAQAIIDTRPFKTKEDVMKVRGIKEGEFAKIKDLITVD